MKTLSKIKLQNAVALEEHEMKRILGGSGGGLSGGCFSCSCDGSGANPPYASSWVIYYLHSEDIAPDINKRCRTGGGCNQTSISLC